MKRACERCSKTQRAAVAPAEKRTHDERRGPPCHATRSSRLWLRCGLCGAAPLLGLQHLRGHRGGLWGRRGGYTRRSAIPGWPVTSEQTARRFRALVVRLACRIAIARANNAAAMARAVRLTRAV